MYSIDNMTKNVENKNLQQREEEKGASLVEYALLCTLIAVVCIVSVKVLGQKSSQRFSTMASAL